MDNNEFNFSDDENVSVEDENTQVQNGKPPRKPFKFGRGTTFIAIVVIVVFVILVFWFVGSSSGIGMSNSHKSKNQDKLPETVSIQAVKDTESMPDNIADSSYESMSSIYSSDTISLEESVDAVDSNIESGSREETQLSEGTENMGTENESTQNTDLEFQSGNSGLIEVADPVLNPAVESSGMVLNKSIYLLDNSYLYEVEMLVLVGEDGNYADMKYYCPRNTFDALNIGDNIYVTYQMSSDGSYSISTISK